MARPRQAKARAAFFLSSIQVFSACLPLCFLPIAAAYLPRLLSQCPCPQPLAAWGLYRFVLRTPSMAGLLLKQERQTHHQLALASQLGPLQRSRVPSLSATLLHAR
ncbi:hypothetical protein J3E68DRAFT_237034 [Trichoderma sp. SZMC 28012]